MIDLAETTNWQDIDTAHYLHPFTDYKALHDQQSLRLIEKGSGCYLWDHQGRRYLDAFAGLACVAIGYGREELSRAAANQILELSYASSFFNGTNIPAVKLAQKLVEITPDGLSHVFFATSGSEANDTALRIARRYWQLEGQPQRQHVICCDHAYHGSTVASGALSGMPYMHEQAASIPGVSHIKAPYKFEYGQEMEEEEFGQLAAGWLEDEILRLGADTVAAFFIEPIQGAGGGKIPPKNYLQEVRKICDRHDVLLVADEVITGFGRTGHWFASDKFGSISPDLMCLAKGITSGYMPLSAVMIQEKIANTLIDKGGEFHHGFTYSGHPVACAVALENIRILSDGVVDNVRTDLAPYFAQKLQAIKEHNRVGEVRSCGLIGAFELVENRKDLSPIANANHVCEHFRTLGFERGIIVRPIGSTVVIAPPLIINIEQIDFLFEQVEQCLEQFSAYLEIVA
jgi:putrescine---pyruvate transaminase